MVLKRITAIVHENWNVRRLEQPRNALPFYGACEFFPGDCASS
jgi:hypothetical protein